MHLQLLGAGAAFFGEDEGSAANAAQHLKHVLRTEAADAVDAALQLAVRCPSLAAVAAHRCNDAKISTYLQRVRACRNLLAASR